jgi:hypothetical protein
VSTRAVVLGFGAAALIAALAGCGSSSSGGAAAAPIGGGVSTPAPTPTHTHTQPAATPTTSPSPTATVTVTAPVTSGPCSSSHLKLSLGIGQGTAGTTYQVLVLTNTGSTSCTLFGYPGVSFVDTSGAIIGQPADRDKAAEHTITLAAGGAANALSRQPDAGNFPAAACQMKTADRVRVYPPGQKTPLFAHDAVQVCSTSKGRTGIGPMLAGNGG